MDVSYEMNRPITLAFKDKPIKVTRFGAIHIGKSFTHWFQKGVSALSKNEYVPAVYL